MLSIDVIALKVCLKSMCSERVWMQKQNVPIIIQEVRWMSLFLTRYIIYSATVHQGGIYSWWGWYTITCMGVSLRKVYSPIQYISMDIWMMGGYTVNCQKNAIYRCILTSSPLQLIHFANPNPKVTHFESWAYNLLVYDGRLFVFGLEVVTWCLQWGQH